MNTSPFMSWLRREWLQLLLLLVPLIAALAAMPYATQRVPMQWGLDGHVNWTAPKTWGLLVTPLCMILTVALVMLFESSDRFRKAEDGGLSPHGRAVRAIRLAISALLLVIVLIQISAALGRKPDMDHLVPSLVTALFAVIGNWFGKLKPNRYAGIRVPWTLNSETVWRETHRFAGWLWTSSGLIMLPILWLVPARSVEVLFLSWVATLILLPLVVAWRTAKREAMR